MADEVLPGRACGSCTLCCKILEIEELAKPQGQWCSNCKTGSGCLIYESRPQTCRAFNCGYLVWPLAGEHWLPSRSKMVILSELDGARVAIHVDPGRPGAWREQPYYADIKRWAVQFAQSQMQVVVTIGRRVFVILPHEDVDLGEVADDERIITQQRKAPDGSLILNAVKMKADDPRLAGN